MGLIVTDCGADILGLISKYRLYARDVVTDSFELLVALKYF